LAALVDKGSLAGLSTSAMLVAGRPRASKPSQACR